MNYTAILTDDGAVGRDSADGSRDIRLTTGENDESMDDDG